MGGQDRHECADDAQQVPRSPHEPALPRLGYLPAEYGEAAKRDYEGVIRTLEWTGKDLQIGNVCIGTGVGDYEHYLNRPASVNDLHGAGAFLLMCTEMQQWLNTQAK